MPVPGALRISKNVRTKYITIVTLLKIIREIIEKAATDSWKVPFSRETCRNGDSGLKV